MDLRPYIFTFLNNVVQKAFLNKAKRSIDLALKCMKGIVPSSQKLL